MHRGASSLVVENNGLGVFYVIYGTCRHCFGII